MSNSVDTESESWLLGIVNRFVRCSHRHHGRPITPRGGGQSYAVCLDCGTRFAYDLNAMRVETPVHGSSLDEEKVLDISEHKLIASAPARRDAIWNDSRWRRRDLGTVVVLCLGGMILAGAFLHSPNRPAPVKHPVTAERPRPSLPADSVEPSPDLPAQESDTEVVRVPPVPESATLATPADSSEPAAAAEQKTMEPDSNSAPAPPPSNGVLRLESKGAVVVLGRKAAAALELAQHPGRLRKLIRRGALFTVPRGTPIKLVQGNRLGNQAVIKVRLMAGSMAGQEGWAQAAQISR